MCLVGRAAMVLESSYELQSHCAPVSQRSAQCRDRRQAVAERGGFLLAQVSSSEGVAEEPGKLSLRVETEQEVSDC